MANFQEKHDGEDYATYYMRVARNHIAFNVLSEHVKCKKTVGQYIRYLFVDGSAAWGVKHSRQFGRIGHEEIVRYFNAKERGIL